MLVLSVLILIYGIGFYFAERLSEAVGIPHIITVFAIPICFAVFLYQIHKSKRLISYGICVPKNLRSVLFIFTALFAVPIANICIYHSTFAVSWYSLTDILLILYLVFFEELLFRGILPSVLSEKCGIGTKPSTIIANAAFAILHIVNLKSGFDFTFWIQILIAFGIGLCFSSIRDRTKSIFPAFIIHFLINASSPCQHAVSSTIEHLIWTIITGFYLIYGIYFYSAKEKLK